jgi:hypothetical protein
MFSVVGQKSHGGHTNDWMQEFSWGRFCGVFSVNRQIGEAAKTGHGRESYWPGGWQKATGLSSLEAYQEKALCELRNVAFHA